ncbi:hypothetical protein L249_7761 [Ophiocordyceps polyrhachis-furcata BCC 54312]|uniref:AB hydrolase-1 domain-containing protein n=1 Tax=Ophiocordyceps polyrhachis-furcata BCC 54312 TaxID=1330021 RepID=A0A367L9Y7_9HYPO|nr:hypothetical protein L249_7761 [Ophiocordyceps polyrhachis-furcata BCC 54312]
MEKAVLIITGNWHVPEHYSRAVLIITGNWHVPEHYSRVMSLLKQKGIRTICRCLPTINNPSPPFKTIRDDIRFIKDIVSGEVEKGTRLTVLCHSYGGMIASASLGEFAADKKGGGVTSIIYMAAFVPSENESLAGLLEDQSQLRSFLDERPDGSCWVPDPIATFFSDQSAEDAEWALRLCVPWCPVQVMLTPIPGDRVAWRTIPSTYIFCETDCALLPETQRRLIDNVRAQGVEMDEYRVQADHSPFVNKPGEVADIVVSVMQRH